MHRLEVSHRYDRHRWPCRLDHLDRQVRSTFEPDVDRYAGFRRRHLEHIIVLTFVALRATPLHRRTAIARRPKIVVTEKRLIDCTRTPDNASVDDHQSS